jgi:hypothetical protein
MWNPFRNRERDLDRELRFHLEEQKKDYVEGGLSQAEARRRTYQEFGGMSQIREACRDVRPLAWLSALGRDVRIGWRFLFRRGTRVSAGIALISLAVGIAGSTLVQHRRECTSAALPIRRS